jgi:hypothetical protein
MKNDQNKKFIDPDNVQEIIEKVYKSPTLGHIIQIINSTYPTWIAGTIDCYSDDYPELSDNWKNVCEKASTNMTKIILVEALFFEEIHTDYKLLKLFAELLTRTGFCIRRKDEFFPCRICNKALPEDFMYNILKQSGKKVPLKWSSTCSTCVDKI